MFESQQTSLLIIDDNSDDRKMFTRFLEKKGFVVFAAENISKGLEIAKNKTISCMLIDYRMPSGSGIDMVKILKADPKLKFIPVIILTGLEEKKHVLEGLEAGADDYVGKSAGEEVILARINALLRLQKLQAEIKTANDKLQKINSELVDANSLKEQALTKLNEAIVKLREVAIRDSLTGLYNHGYFLEVLENEFMRAKRYNQNICCLMMDIDHFKSINDKFGHLFGDKVLALLADCLRSNTRKVDFLCRYGGEEFVILLFNTNYKGALEDAQRLRKYIERYNFQDGKNSMNLTVSIGISSLFEDGMLDKEKFLNAADTALYRAKTEGRNTVSMYKDTAAELESADIDTAELETTMFGISGSTKKSYMDAVKTLIVAHEEKDIYTREHSINVLRYSLMVLDEMGISGEEKEIIGNAAILHDLGKIGISDSILFKKGKLTDEEFEIVKRHPIIAVRILQSNSYIRKELQVILHHHERFDGKGYPEGLKGQNIPLGARIIAVADSYDAMRSARPYRGAMPMAFIISELVNTSGTQFDPWVVYNFLEALIKHQLIPSEINIRDGLEKVRAKMDSQRYDLYF